MRAGAGPCSTMVDLRKLKEYLGTLADNRLQAIGRLQLFESASRNRRAVRSSATLGAGLAWHRVASPGIDSGAQQAEQGAKRGQVFRRRVRQEQGRSNQELSRCRGLAQGVGS